MKQNKLIIILGILFFINALAGVAFAQEKYPDKPINFIIGYPAGGSTDVCARPLVAAASKILGQPVIVVNKPGGSSAVAMASLKN
jgi:tripartite-type tricarboxylate transporter receptor subunit TctC